jgi:hypothetical protein
VVILAGDVPTIDDAATHTARAARATTSATTSED